MIDQGFEDNVRDIMSFFKVLLLRRPSSSPFMQLS